MGVARAAEEAGTSKWVILKWLDRMEKTMATIPQPYIPESAAEQEAKTETTTTKGTEDMDEAVKTNGTEAKRSSKDFTPEEREVITNRAKQVGSRKAAAEFGTTWQAIEAWLRASKPRKPKAAKAPKEDGRRKPKKVQAAEPGKKFTPEEVAAILARSDVVGAKQAAEEFGTTSYAIGGWRKAARMRENVKAASAPKPTQAKAAKETPAPAAKVDGRRKRHVEAAAPVAPVAPAKPVESAKPAARSTSLEVENALLKDKVESLTQQLEKLRSVVAQMAQYV